MIGYAGLTVLVLLIFNPSNTEATGNIGCLFSETLCGQDQEWCFEDDAFGRCLPLYDHVREDDLHRYDLNTDELHLLEQEMQRLFLLGYRWSHTYTQCVLKELLDSIRYNTEYNASSCNDELDQDLEGALKAIEGEEMEHVNPQDLAIVRFTPSENDPHSAYADEVYLPHIKERLQTLAKQGGKSNQEGHDEHRQENSVLGNEIKSEDESNNNNRMQHDDRNNENNNINNNHHDNSDNNNQDNNIYPDHNNNNNNHVPTSHQDTFFPARPQHNNPDEQENNYINNYYNHDYEFEDPYSSQYNYYNNDEQNFNKHYYRKRNGDRINDFGKFNKLSNNQGPLQDKTYISSAINHYPYQDQDIFAGMREKQLEGDGLFGMGGGYMPDDTDLYNPAGLPNNEVLTPKQVKAYAELLESLGALNGKAPRLDISQETVFVPERFLFSNMKNEESFPKNGIFREGPAKPVYHEAGQTFYPQVGNEDQAILSQSLNDFTPEQILAMLPPDEIKALEEAGLLYAKDENQAVNDYAPEAQSKFGNFEKTKLNGGFEYQPKFYGPTNFNEKDQDIFKMYPFLRGLIPQPENAEEEMLLKQLVEDPYNKNIVDNLDDSLKKVLEDDGFATDLKKPANSLREAFGDQLSELDGSYVPDYPDYPNLMLNYPDYPDFLGPIALPYKEKLAKKDEETINGDFGDDFMAREWSFQRPGRYDVKKPGPYFNSENNYAFADQQGYDTKILGPFRPAYDDTGLLMRGIVDREPENDIITDQLGEVHAQPDVIKDEEHKVDEARDKLHLLKKTKTADNEDSDDKADNSSDIKYEKLRSESNESEEADEAKGQPYIFIKIKDGYETEGANYEKLLLKLVEAVSSLTNLKNVELGPVRPGDTTVMFKIDDTKQDPDKVADIINSHEKEIEKLSGVQIDEVGVALLENPDITELYESNQGKLFVAAAIICGGMAAMLVAATAIFLVRRRSRTRAKLQGLAGNDAEASKDYEAPSMANRAVAYCSNFIKDLCRARKISGNVTGEGKKEGNQSCGPGGGQYCDQRVTNISKENDNGNSPSSTRTSTSSWSEEPVASNMDISTGHMVLSYMEDHLKRKDRLEKEWISLCGYEPDGSCATTIALSSVNKNKNRYLDAVPYDHNRVTLNAMANSTESDYINASSITDHDPRNPAYIATQGPLSSTACDFWQMVWERGSVVIVMLTRLSENGQELCHYYWPKEGSELYHIYEVHLVSEHIWCDDYLVRSFYLKNNRTSETRTVTQFHFLSWPESGIPASTKALLEFRRKVNKSYRGRCCPVIVHCSDGIGRAGTYCLIDMVLNRTVKGAKEIDIAATLEHIRDQRPGMVKTKSQFEFVLMSVAEEVHAILKALPQ